MSDAKIINIDSFRPKMKLSSTYGIFDMASTIKNCQDDLIKKIVVRARIELEELLLVIRSKPYDSFDQRVKLILENIIIQPELVDPDSAYILLVYFIKTYIPVIDVRATDEIMVNDTLEIIAHPKDSNDLMIVSLLNTLLLNSKKIMEVQKARPVDLLYQVLTLYEAE